MIAIEKHKSSIIINNKGELLFPKDEFWIRSEPRNKLLVDLLARTDFMEKAGTGIKRIMEQSNHSEIITREIRGCRLWLRGIKFIKKANRC